MESTEAAGRIACFTPLRLFLCGDVVTGRGFDQVLPHPLNPRLYEPNISDARSYVDLAENANGLNPRPVDLVYLWGEALHELRRAKFDLKNVSLDTAIT